MNCFFVFRKKKTSVNVHYVNAIIFIKNYLGYHLPPWKPHYYETGKFRNKFYFHLPESSPLGMKSTAYEIKYFIKKKENYRYILH